MRRRKIEYGYVSTEDFQKILAQISAREDMYAVAFGLMRYRGLRPCEVLQMRIQDITEDGRIKHHASKTNTHNLLDLPDFFKIVLFRYIENNKHRFINGYMFASYNSKDEHIAVNTLSKKFRKHFSMAGLSCDFEIDTNKTLLNAGRKLHYIRLYDLRASFGTDVMLRTNYNQYKTMVMLNQVDPRSTMAYMRKAVLVEQKSILNICFQ